VVGSLDFGCSYTATTDRTIHSLSVFLVSLFPSPQVFCTFYHSRSLQFHPLVVFSLISPTIDLFHTPSLPLFLVSFLGGDHLSALNSFGAAHDVAQCCRWKTAQYGQAEAQIRRGGNGSRHREGRKSGNGRGLHSSTQSSAGPLESSSDEAAVTRSTHSS
jgi:hypothetical protein